MSRYPATREGAVQLLTLANTLRSANDRVSDCSYHLQRQLYGLSASNHSEIFSRIEAIAYSTARRSFECGEPIRQVADKLSKLSDTIIDIIGSDPNTSAQALSSGLAASVRNTVAAGANKAYVNEIIERMSNMPAGTAKLYGAYGKRCRISTVLEPRNAAYFSPSENAVHVNQADDLSNPLGSCNTFFHETGHQIDWVAGHDKGGQTPVSYQMGMAVAIREDYENAVKGIMTTNSCSREAAERALRIELCKAPDAANCVSDVFGGVSHNKVTGKWGHDTSYWTGPQSDINLATEAFAEISADMACNNTSHIDFTRKWMPKTYELYERIVRSIT